jgi:hypothetical protein
MKNIIEVPYFNQDRLNYDCGPLCIRMIESYFKGRRISEKSYQKNILELAMDGNPKYCYGTSKKTHEVGNPSVGLSLQKYLRT